MNPGQTAHEQARQLLDEMGIAVIPTTKGRCDGETCAVATVAAIIERYDVGHAALVVRSIAETEGNERQLISPVLWSLSDLIAAYPEWAATSRWLEAFDDIDIGAFVDEARRNRAACPLRPAITTFLGAMLRQVFDPEGKARRKLYTRRPGDRRRRAMPPDGTQDATHTTAQPGAVSPAPCTGGQHVHAQAEVQGGAASAIPGTTMPHRAPAQLDQHHQEGIRPGDTTHGAAVAPRATAQAPDGRHHGDADVAGRSLREAHEARR